jgi:hypothetical protein
MSGLLNQFQSALSAFTYFYNAFIAQVTQYSSLQNIFHPFAVWRHCDIAHHLGMTIIVIKHGIAPMIE